MKKIALLSMLVSLVAILIFSLTACGGEHEHVGGVSRKENELKATCTREGSYDEVVICVDCGEIVSIEHKTEEKSGHTLGKNITEENRVEPTCKDEGTYDEVSECEVCGERISAKKTIPVINEHTPAEAVEENNVEGTCPEKGSYESVVYCAVCNVEISRTKMETFVTHKYVDGACSSCGELKPSEGLSLKLVNDEYTVTGIGTCTDTNIVIPVKYNGVPVTSISEKAFKNCTNVIDVIIPEGVSSIGNNAFYNCKNLVSVTIPESVSMIDYGAFFACVNLENVYITDISSWCNILFSGSDANPLECANKLYIDGEIVTKLVIPDDITSIGEYAFCGYSAITEIIIPNGVTTIGYAAFYNCSKLRSITIPDSVTEIGRDAFRDCFNLTSVTIGNGITKIDEGAFYDCRNLFDVYITDLAKWCSVSLTTESSAPFSYAKNLYIDGKPVTELSIPEGVTEISSLAFNNCKVIEWVTIPDSVTLIDSNSFMNCANLKGVNFGNSVSEINSSAFSGCIGLTSITLPGSITSIKNAAFVNCYRLVEIINHSSLDITKGSSDFGKVAYYAKEVHMSESKIVDKDGYLFITSEGINYLVGYTGKERSLILPDKYNGENYEIAQYAFYNCGKINSVIIPSSVIGIGENVFSNELVEVINRSSFSLPENALVKHTGGSKIVNKDNYLFVTVNGVNYLVDYIGNENELTLPESYNGESYQIYSNVFSGRKNITSVSIGNGVTVIGANAFYGCSSLVDLSIGNNVTEISWEAFKHCSNLVSVVIPDSVTVIGYSAFSSCNSLSNLLIGKGVTEIGTNAFEYCYSLRDVVIPDSVTTFGGGVFYNCRNLLNVTIGNGLTVIEERLFSHCQKLTTITISQKVTEIAQRAFSDCELLADVYYAGTEEEWANIAGGNSKLENVTVHCNHK